MTLQRKFAILLLIMAIAVVANLAAALWALRFAQGEFVRPLVTIQLILPRLGEVKAKITIEASLLGGSGEVAGFPFPAPPQSTSAGAPLDAFKTAAADVVKHLDHLEALDQYNSMVGISTARNLRKRIEDARDDGLAWLSKRDPAAQPAVLDQFKQVHDLIERMEATVTRSGTAAVQDYAPNIQFWLLLDLLASLIIVILVCVLGVILLRRWVVHPVRELREAADKLAKGDFSYRVRVSGQDELGQLSAEVNHMADMISSMQEERVDRERLAAAGEVVRRLAHNLRNPLAGIRSLAELTRSDLPQDSLTRENQDRILQTVDRFEHWLAGLLSATTPLRIVPQPVPIAGWLNGLVESLRPSATAKGVGIRVDVDRAPPTALFDPHHMEQALVGIITNAIQASPTGAEISITASTCEDGKTWELGVADRGPGVPDKLVDKIFRPYFTTKRDGTGIGLAVAKQVVEQHAGRIRVESAFSGLQTTSGGLGARFLLSLPLAGPPELANTGHIDAGNGARFGQGPGYRR